MKWTEWKQYKARQMTIIKSRQCAVLVPLVNIKGEQCLAFQVRSRKLDWQPGDICFPGGSLEVDDQTVAAGAIRETVEELGISESQIHLLGPLDYVVSPVGVTVWPVVACLDTSDFKLSREEVDHVFTVPLTWLLQHEPQQAVMQFGTRAVSPFPHDLLPQVAPDWREHGTYAVYLYRYGAYTIWGITAAIVKNFVERYQAIEFKDDKMV